MLGEQKYPSNDKLKQSKQSKEQNKSFAHLHAFWGNLEAFESLYKWNLLQARVE